MIKTLLGSLREYKRGSILTILFSVLEAAFEILIPLRMADLIDQGIDLGNMAAVWKFGIAILIFAALQLLTGILSAHIAAKTSVGFSANLRQDTLRQMIAQSMAQLISSFFTIVAVFVCMLYVSFYLTLVAMLVMLLILQIVKMVTGKIGVFFVMQQKTLADVNGYVEEMVNGQKVIKVFCHEETAKKELAEKNRAWASAAASANGYANSIMPMMNALGYVQYVIIAILGGYMAISGITNIGLQGTGVLTLGAIASFLTLSRNFNNPISQISNQFNSIVTALAGASRIFAFMDEQPETDEGYVTLVNVEEENGELREAEKRTGIWGVEASASRWNADLYQAGWARCV